MARAPNAFYYNDDNALGAALGATLGKALFGDPDAATKLTNAQMANYKASADEAGAHAGLYRSQTAGQDTQNTAATSLPDLIRSLVAPPPQAPQVAQAQPVDPLAPLPAASPSPAPQAANADMTPPQFRNGLPSLFAALTQMQGDKVDPKKVLGGLAAMFGNDELGRRGMVGEGVTPGKDFALTPERADQIAQQGYDARYKTDTAVAGINHATDVPVANINAGARVKSAEIGAGATVDSANLHANASRDVAQIRETARPRMAAGKVRYINAAAYKLLFGDNTLPETDPKYLGELGQQLKMGPWANMADPRTADQQALTILRQRVAENYQKTGNPVQAVTDAMQWALETEQGNQSRAAAKGVPPNALRQQAQQAIAQGADRTAVASRFRRMTGQNL